MITESQKRILKNKIKQALRESMFENGYFENMFSERKRPKPEEHEKESSDAEGDKKRTEVMKWLDSAQELHSILAYKLWPDMDEDEARSLFSKKYRGEDADGNSYSFDDDDINTLFNMKDRYIDEIS